MSASEPSPVPPKRPTSDPTVADAQARLDQMRAEAGGALTGREVADRAGIDGPVNPDPPLDWRLTPRNILLQLLAVGLFVAVVWFLVSLVTDSLSALFA